MGMDSAWYPCFVEAYFESQASSDLPIWRVFKQIGDAPSAPITAESSWEQTWERVNELRRTDTSAKYNCAHTVEYRRSEI